MAHEFLINYYLRIFACHSCVFALRRRHLQTRMTMRSALPLATEGTQELNTNFSQIIIYEYSRVIRVYSRCVADKNLFEHEWPCARLCRLLPKGRKNDTRISHIFIFMNHSWLFVDIRVASQTYSNTNGHALGSAACYRRDARMAHEFLMNFNLWIWRYSSLKGRQNMWHVSVAPSGL